MTHNKVNKNKFAVRLNHFIKRHGRRTRQLSDATAAQFGSENRVPHNTISRWQRGEVAKPRLWPDIVKVAAVLQLSKDELIELLEVSGHPNTTILSHTPPLPGLFTQWQEKTIEHRPFQAPALRQPIVGQAGIRDAMKRYLCSQNQSRACCLIGMAGLGKTSLAMLMAQELSDQFLDGVLWISLQTTDTSTAIQTIASAYNEDLHFLESEGGKSSKLRDMLATKNALLILDGVKSDEEIIPLMPPNGNCAVLITSRRQDLSIIDTSFSIFLSPTKGMADIAEELFAQVLDRTTSQNNRAVFQELAITVGHLPLAVNILANRLASEAIWTPTKLLERLQQPSQTIALLQRGNQHIKRLFDQWINPLPSNDKKLLGLGAIFPKSFTAPSLMKMMEKPLWQIEDTLQNLLNHSLLWVENERFYMHTLVRAYAIHLLETKNWEDAFIDTFTDVPSVFGEVEAEQENIVSATKLAFEKGKNKLAITAVLDIAPFLQQTAQFDLVLKLLVRAEKTVRKNENKLQLSQLLNQSGYVSMKVGKPKKAKQQYREALALAKEANLLPQMADSLLKLGALAYRQSQLEEAQEQFSEGLEIATQLNDNALIASFVTNLGLIEAARGNLLQAIEQYQRALPIARNSKKADLIIGILQNLGNMLEERGDYAQAKIYYSEGLDLAKAQNDPELTSRMLGNLGAIMSHLRNYAEATAYFREGYSFAEDNDLTIQMYRQQANLGQVAALRGLSRQSNIHYAEALRIARQLNFPEDLGMILNQVGENWLSQDRFEEAANAFDEALQLSENNNLLRVEPHSRFGLAQIAAARGNIKEAHRIGQKSQHQLATIGHRKANEVWWWLKELPEDPKR